MTPQNCQLSGPIGTTLLDKFGHLTVGVDVAGLATACLCLIMKIPMNQAVQGFSKRFLPLFGCFERNLIFGAASRVLIMFVA